HQQAIASFNLDTSTSIDPHLAAQQGRCQRVADTEQTLVHRRLSLRKLCKSWKRNWIFPGCRSKPSALKCINVKKINYINVVQRCLQNSGKSPCARPQIRLGSVRRTRPAGGGSPTHCCRRRQDGSEQAQHTLQFPHLTG